MKRILDHIDLRVRNLRACEPFYRAFLPLVGFTRHVEIPGWLQFMAEGAGAQPFFGVTEDLEHRPNKIRVAFWADSNATVDKLAAELKEIGALNIEGPLFESEGYYAVFFEDPSGNPLEICHRLENSS
jgi:catechol 2,3-dioxygenase-like lactoylglutathione lyase family enzyme